MLFSVIGGSNIIGRIGFGLLGQLPYLSSMCLYNGGFFFTAVVVAIIPSLRWFVAMAFFAGIFGALNGCFGAHLPKVGHA